MLKKRLIPSLLVRDGRIVQSVQFRHTNVIGNVITAVDFFNGWAVDEILILDVSRDHTGREEFLDIVDELSERCFVPLAVGGWIASIEDVETLLEHGADKITVNTHAFRNPAFITEAAKAFGSQCIVVSIDVRRDEDGVPIAWIDRGRESTGEGAVEWAKRAVDMGAGEILLTSIDNDGTRNGYDLALMKSVSEAVSVPVIAFGGVGHWSHMVAGVKEGGADAVSAGNIFHFTEHSTKKAKEYLRNADVDVRDTFFYRVSIPRRPRYKQY
ncbi:MAG: imidazole glycerol phosphate synthase subunit HisF [Burkholderiales bacterium]